MYLRPTTTEVRAELIAREREIGVLSEARKSASGGHGRIVLISGDAGIGKTRLLRQFEATLGGSRSLTASTRCVEFVQTPLAPLRELLQGLERGNAQPREQTTRALIDRLAFERGSPAATTEPDGWLFESIDAALARYALRGTVVLLLEDIHWADRSTLGFLTYLADRISDRRILVVATYRSGEVDASSSRLADFSTLLAQSTVTDLALEPLDERAARALIDASIPAKNALDTATIADIVRRSQGNPFFIEQLVKSVVARGAKADGERLPLSIRGAVLARAAALGEDDRKMLSLAAVLGERFDIERLVALSEAPRENVLSALQNARALQLVDDRRTAPGQFAFQHALTQEVFYGELLTERVRPLHEAIGLELERRPDRNAVVVELAHHWRRAGDAERAGTYAELAGDRALAIGAFADAVWYYERALAERKKPGETAPLGHKIGLALISSGHLHEGIRRLRQASEQYLKIGDFEGFANNAAVLASAMHNAGDAAAGIEICRRTIDEYGPSLPPGIVDLLRARMAYHCVGALDFPSALAFASEIREPIADPLTAAYAYQARFKVAAMLGDIDAWRANAARALDVAHRLDDDGYRIYQTHIQIALDAMGVGEVESAREHFRAALETQRIGDAADRNLANAASSLEHTLRGDFAEAANLLGRVGSSEQGYAKLAHVKCAQFALGIFSGDETRLRRDDTESFLRYGLEHGMKLVVGLVGGPYAWALGVRGEIEDAAAWIRRMAPLLPGPHRFMFAFLAAAQFGARADVVSMRRLLAESAARPQDRVNKATLALFDAFAGQRGIGSSDVAANALEAAHGFESIGWPWLAARAYELAGETKRALEAYRAVGAVRDLRRLEAGRGDDLRALLSPASWRSPNS